MRNLDERFEEMPFLKCMIVILIYLVSRVSGFMLADDISDEKKNSRDRVEAVTRNFQRYWITAKGRKINFQTRIQPKLPF